MSDPRRTVLRSGRLLFEVGEHAWSCAVVDAEAGPILREPPLVDGSPLGSFGFQTADAGRTVWRGGPLREAPGPHNEEPPSASRWWHAVAMLEAQGRPSSFRATLATDDPLGRRLAIEVCPAGDGVLSVRAAVLGETSDVVAVGHSFLASPGERFLGFGERSDAVVRTQGVVEHYVGEGPWQAHEYPLVAEVIPPWGLRQRRDASYFPLPWVLSVRGYGLCVDNDEISYVRLRTERDDTWSVEVESRVLAYRVVAGPRPADALRRYTELVGRQPAPGAPWWFGPWYQSGHASQVPAEEEERQLALLRAARAPVSAVETHCRFLPAGAHRGWEEAERKRTGRYHAQGLATLGYLSALVAKDYEAVYLPAAMAGALQRRADGTVCSFPGYLGDRDPPVAEQAQFDFSTEAGRRAWAEVAAQLVSCGHDGWMEDFGEYTPLDAAPGGPDTAVGTSGQEPGGTAEHNRYPTEYHRAADRTVGVVEGAAGRPLARFVRSGWKGTAPHAPIVWGGDPSCTWGFDGLASAVVEGLSMGASGIAMWGSDTGGFASSVDRLTPELLQRWITFSACCPLMRTKAAGIELPPYERPQIWDPEVIGVWSRWAAWHTQLNGYLQAAHAEYRSTGMPIMRPLALVWPEDPELAGVEDQYLLGPDLLVAPVLAPGSRSREVVVPPGRWVDLWRAARYEKARRRVELSGATALQRAAGGGMLEGVARVEVPAPVEEIPLLVRAGAVLALLSAEVDTLTDYGGDDCPVVRASEREAERRLLAWPCGRSRSWIGPGQGVVSEEHRGGWALTVEGGPVRRYEIAADMRLLDGGPFAPAGVAVDGVDLAADAWHYDGEAGVLSAVVTLGAGTLEVDRARRQGSGRGGTRMGIVRP